MVADSCSEKEKFVEARKEAEGKDKGHLHHSMIETGRFDAAVLMPPIWCRVFGNMGQFDADN